MQTTRIIATVNAMREGNRAYRELADPSTYRPLFGVDAGDEDAGRHLTYAVEAAVPQTGDPQDALAVFRAQDNVFHAELDERAFGIPEDLPPRMPEVEAAEDDAMGHRVPESAVLEYLGLLGGGLTGAGAVHPNGLEVAVLDTGLDIKWANRKGDRLAGHAQFTDEPHTAIEAVHFHGSHVAGSLTANTNLRLNVAQVLDDDGSGYTSWIMDGLYWAVRNGCRIANLSLGGGAPSAAMGEAVRYARSRGCLVVCAMGNDGVNERQYPAGYPDSTAVIASSYRDQMRARFSNWGDWAHGTTDGVDVLSWGIGGVLVRASGTSMATPHYARVLAMLIAEFGSPATVLKVAGRTAIDTPEPVLEEGNGRISGEHIAAELRR